MRGAERLARAMESISAELGLGVGANRGMRVILVLSSMLLSIASGYTTYVGLRYSLPFIPGLFATLAIQGLLFAMCWRIAAAVKSHQRSVFLLLIYALTGSVSAFFSFVGLLNQVYIPEYYQEDSKSAVEHEAAEGVATLKAAAQKGLADAISSDPNAELVRAWLAQMNSTLQQDLARLQAQQASLNAAVNASKAKFDIEFQHGGTPVYGGG